MCWRCEREQQGRIIVGPAIHGLCGGYVIVEPLGAAAAMALVSAVTIAVFVVMRGTGGQCEGTTDRRAICEEQVPQVVVDDVARWLGVGRIAHRVGGAGNGQLSAIVSEEAYLLKVEKVACGSTRQLSFWIRRLQQKVRGACTPGTRTDVKTNLKLSVAGGQFRRKLHDTSMLRTRCRDMEKRRGRASRACSWRTGGCPLDLPPMNTLSPK